ncbi:MAG TPA: GNAT family N-acetyltransferase [Balneolales bacterium]|nr:GNAT family N-acetyltransferase [Balneolales bacterium]
MIIKDRSLSEVDEHEWDTFVRSSNNGTIFSEAHFFHHHEEDLDIRFISCHDGIDIIAGIVGSFRGNQFISPTGASYGGFLVPSLSFTDTEKGLVSLLEYFKDIGVNKISVTFPPLAYYKEINQNLDFLMRYYGFQETLTLLSSITDTTKYDKTSISSMCRRAVKKSVKKGIEIKNIADISEFYEILVKNKAKFNLKPTHSETEIRSLLSLYPDDICLMGAYYQEKLIAGVMNMRCTPDVLLTFYIASDYEYQKLRPVNRLLHEICIKAKKNQVRYVDFGVSMETNTENSMDPRRSLIYFKEHFNSKGYLRSRFELEL